MTRHSWLKTLRQLIYRPYGHQSAFRSGKARCQPKFAAEIQILETRKLLSGAPVSGHAPTTGTVNAASVIQPDFLRLDAVGKNGIVSPFGTSSPNGLTPAQMRQAYGMNSIQFGGVTGDGSGQTIAIVDAYDDPNAITDLAAFDLYFGLSNPPNFKVLNQFGGTTRPVTDPAGPGFSWAVESSLDIEWAHVMAPKAKIILFEANSNSFNDLFAAVDTARYYPGVSAVSMSFGTGGDFYGETGYDYHFVTPTGHQGVTFIASTGDNGAPGGYPALSPKVVAVGGTTLSTSPAGNYLGESGWSGSGGGYSYYEPEPTYQRSVQRTGERTIPDVSMDADPNSGVPVFDTFDFGVATPWEQVGGTSLAAPMFAGVIAVADQGRVVLGGTTLDGYTGTLPAIYKLPTTDFHDITTGNNGYSAGKGYDLVTGIGSPVANNFVPDLAIGATVIVYPPSISGMDTSTLTFAAGGSAVSIAPTIALTDLSSPMLTGAVIQFTSGYNTNRDWLSVISTPNITGVFYYATGRMLLTGTASVAEYQSVIRSIKFNYTGKVPSLTTRQISIQVTDSDTPNVYDSNVVTRSINVR